MVYVGGFHMYCLKSYQPTTSSLQISHSKKASVLCQDYEKQC